MSTITVEAEWQALRELAISKDATDEQLLHLRRVFYCGAQSMLLMMVSLPDGEPEAAAAIDAFRAELREFAVAVDSGAA